MVVQHTIATAGSSPADVAAETNLAARIASAALLEGEFTLRSGRKSRYYIDKYLFETDPHVLREVAARLAAFAGPPVQRIAGAELGAVALAAAVSLHTGLPFVIVRNSKKADYGTGKLIEGTLREGERVLLVEDVATSGGQALEAARLLREHGAIVERIVAVIDRQEGAREAVTAAGIPFDALLTSAQILATRSGTPAA
ncbi:MAG: orotate phosphoribosyltransferase [Planctomycetia bacterium]|nr:MAG: orotate phosphoribosyltransferase [Planctomycetia bacterium]